VEAPVPPSPLTEGKEQSVWEYDQLIEDIQRKECERANERLVERETLATEGEKKKEEEEEKIVHSETPLCKEVCVEIRTKYY
jgi:hypothetical protein